MNGLMPVIHDLAGAAVRARVTEEVILRWIREGLRAMPVGRVGRRGPRDYRIFDSWLVEFMERRAGEALAPPAGRTKRNPPPSGDVPRIVIPKLKDRA